MWLQNYNGHFSKGQRQLQRSLRIFQKICKHFNLDFLKNMLNIFVLCIVGCRMSKKHEIFRIPIKYRSKKTNNFCALCVFPWRVSETPSTLYKNALYFIQRRITVNAADSSAYGIRGVSHKLFSNFLHNRMQCTKIEVFKSSYKKISCGVPQSSVISPLLFLIYITDITKASSFHTTLFADDNC